MSYDNSDRPIYSDFTMPGRTDALFRWLTGQDMPQYADGQVDTPTGWFAAIDPSAAEIREAAAILDDPHVGAFLKVGHWYLVRIDGAGLVWAESYEGLDGFRPVEQQRRRALADFNRLTRRYNRYLDEVGE